VGRLFFAMPTSVETMFPYFSSLCSWLLKECAVSFVDWNEFDDMTHTCNTILSLAKPLGLNTANIPVYKLAQCAAEPVCDVLDFLTTRALVSRGFDTPTPSYAAAARSEEAAVDAKYVHQRATLCRLLRYFPSYNIASVCSMLFYN